MTEVQLYSTPPNSANPIARNWTGLYIGSNDSRNVGKSRLLIPPLMTKYYESKVDNKKWHRNCKKFVFHKSTDYWKPQPKIKISPSLVLHDNVDDHHSLHLHKHFLRNGSVKESNTSAINLLTRKNQRELTLSNNSGVKHFEDLNSHTEVTSLTSEKNGHMLNLIEPNKLVTELLQQRHSMLGIDVCLQSLEGPSSKELKNLLPKFNAREFVCRSAISPLRKPSNPSTNRSFQLQLNLPKSAPANHRSLPPFVPGAVFYCRFGKMNKTEKVKIQRHKQQQASLNCDDDGREGTGFLSRFGQQRQNIIDQLRPTSAEVEHDKFSRREPLDNVRNKTDQSMYFNK